MAAAQQACVYASFILDGGEAATIVKVCKAAGVEVPASLADAFGKLYAGKKVGDLVKNVSFGGGAAPAPSAAPAAGKKDEKPAAPAKKEEKKPEPEDDDDLMGGLF